jgi:hypothetical protein
MRHGRAGAEADGGIGLDEFGGLYRGLLFIIGHSLF